MSVAFSPNGLLLAAGAENGTIHVFDISTGKLVHSMPGHSMAIRSMTFTPDSVHLITASDDKRVNIYGIAAFNVDVHHANVVATLSGHQSWVLAVSASCTGKEFATGFERMLI